MDENYYAEPLSRNTSPIDGLQNAERAILAISGLGCQHCVTQIQNRLLSLEGVYGADVYLHAALAIVIFDKHRLSPSELILAVAHAGNDGRHEYDAALIAAE